MSNFKSGDLALIVGGSMPDQLGKVVELLFFIRSREEYAVPGYAHLVRNVSGGDVWLVKGDVGMLHEEGGSVDGFCQKAESNLLPLRGDFQPEQQKSREVPA